MGLFGLKIPHPPPHLPREGGGKKIAKKNDANQVIQLVVKPLTPKADGRPMTKADLRYGYTTGACAAAAAKGAALMLREREVLLDVEIILPGAVPVRFCLHGQSIGDNSASCYVVKDGGDDPDVTSGAEIHVTVRADYFAKRSILIEGGPGIGRVTKPGLAVGVGEWAINPVPRRMIREAVREVFAMRCIPMALTVTVSIPNGEELAGKTLNARLGIVGGLSILGTTGIVKPVSAKAWTDTIDTAIDVALACGSETVVLSGGRTSELAVQKYLSDEEPGNLPEEAFVMMGDHVGHALRSCARKGVRNIILAGQFAKLLKIACGHEQTHASSSSPDLETLGEWLAADPHASRFAPRIKGMNTARQVLEDSDNAAALVQIVCNRAAQYAGSLARDTRIKVFLAGYGGEVLYFG